MKVLKLITGANNFDSITNHQDNEGINIILMKDLKKIFSSIKEEQKASEAKLLSLYVNYQI